MNTIQNKSKMKYILSIAIIMGFLTLAIVTKNPAESKLYAAFSIIAGAYASYLLSSQRLTKK